MANRGLEREEYWRGIIEGWTESDLSQRRFCEATRISYSTFCYWRRRLSTLDGPEDASKRAGRSETHPFVPVEIKPSVRTLSPLYYEVTLESGRQVRVPFQFEPESLVQLIAILEGNGC